MFENLAQMMQQPQVGMPQGQMPMQRPDAIANAGMLIMSGMLPKEAYVQGARMAREQEMGLIAQQKQAAAQNERMQYNQLADYLRQNPNASNQELAAMGLQLGVNPVNLPAFLGALGTQEQVVEDKLYGGPPQIFTKTAGVYKRPDMQSPRETSTSKNRTIENGNLPNAGHTAGEMKEGEAIELAKTPVAVAENNEPIENDEKFIQYVDKIRPQADEPRMTLDKEKINLKNYQKYRDEHITPIFQTVDSFRDELSLIRNASKIFETGALADKREAALALGKEFNISNPEKLAAAEIIRKASSQLSATMLKKLGGRVLAAEIPFVQQQVPLLTTSEEGNRQIMDYLEKINDRQENMANAAELFFEKRNHINGFDRYYNKFLKKEEKETKENRSKKMGQYSKEELIKMYLEAK
jgi:hypothetical protein